MVGFVAHRCNFVSSDYPGCWLDTQRVYILLAYLVQGFAPTLTQNVNDREHTFSTFSRVLDQTIIVDHLILGRVVVSWIQSASNMLLSLPYDC